MALSIIQEPPDVSLNDNDILLEVETDNFITSYGTKAYLALAITDIPVTDDQFNIYSDDFNLTFTFKPSPDDSGLQLSNNYLTASALADYLVLALTDNYFINKFCVITQGVIAPPSELNYIKIEYREVGNVGFCWEYLGATGIGYLYHSGGSDEAVRPGYKIHVVCDGIELMKTPDEDQRVLFNFKKLVELEGGYKWPETEHEAILRANFLQQLNIKYFEKYDGVNPQKLMNLTKTFFLGGISRKALNYLAEQEKSWYDYLTENKKFLTWSPSYKIIDSSATVKLYYYVTEKITGIQARVKINDDENQISSLTVQTVEDGKVYEIILSPRFIFSEAELPDIWKFDVWLVKQNSDIISEVKSFYIDWFYHEFRREFLFSNSYKGAYDSFVFYGKSEENADLNNYLYEHRITDIELKGVRQSRSLLQETFKATTGFLNRDTLYYLDELLQSEDRYEVIGGRLYPIVITSSKIFRRRDGDDLYKLQIEYSRSWQEEFYDNILPSEGIPYIAGAIVAPAGGSGSGGHIIVDPAGSIKPQRKYLKFTASGIAAITVTDDALHDTTIVNVDATQEESETSAWKNISLEHINTTPMGDLLIETTIDLRSVIGAGDVLKIKVGGVWKYGFVFNITNQVISFKGEIISDTIQELRVGYSPQVGGWFMVPAVVAYGSFADADESTLVATDIQTQLNAGSDNLKILCAKAFCTEIDSGVPNAQAKYQIKVDSTGLHTAVALNSALTWYYTTSVDSSNNTLSRTSVVGCAITAATGALAVKNAKNLTIMVFAVKTNLP